MKMFTFLSYLGDFDEEQPCFLKAPFILGDIVKKKTFNSDKAVVSGSHNISCFAFQNFNLVFITFPIICDDFDLIKVPGKVYIKYWMKGIQF